MKFGVVVLAWQGCLLVLAMLLLRYHSSTGQAGTMVFRHDSRPDFGEEGLLVMAKVRQGETTIHID